MTTNNDQDSKKQEARLFTLKVVAQVLLFATFAVFWRPIVGNAMLTLHLVPAEAATDACQMPGWLMREPVAYACDMKDAVQTGATTVSGARTHQPFFRSRPNPTGYVLVYALKGLDEGDAVEAAKRIGAYGGLVREGITIESPYGSWKATLANFAIPPEHVLPVGAIVAMIPPPLPPSVGIVSQVGLGYLEVGGALPECRQGVRYVSGCRERQ